MKKKAIAYYFQSESCDSYLSVDIVDENIKPLNVVDAMEKFGWDCGLDYWMKACGCNTKEELLKELPYVEFMTAEEKID